MSRKGGARGKVGGGRGSGSDSGRGPTRGPAPGSAPAHPCPRTRTDTRQAAEPAEYQNINTEGMGVNR